MVEKYAKSLKNLLIRAIVYTFFMKKNFYFFIFLKPRYNWYNYKKLAIPTLNCSNLYQTPLVQLGTIGTIFPEVSNTNDLRGARVYFYIIYFYFINLGVYRSHDQK